MSPAQVLANADSLFTLPGRFQVSPLNNRTGSDPESDTFHPADTLIYRESIFRLTDIIDFRSECTLHLIWVQTSFSKQSHQEH